MNHPDWEVGFTSEMMSLNGKREKAKETDIGDNAFYSSLVKESRLVFYKNVAVGRLSPKTLTPHYDPIDPKIIPIKEWRNELPSDENNWFGAGGASRYYGW